MKRVIFLVGIGLGYALGTRAGRERYAQLARSARRLADRPEVQSVAGLAAASVSRVVRGPRG